MSFMMAASADGSCAAISAAIRTVGPEWRLSPAIEFELQLAFASNLPVVPILGREADLIQLTSGLPAPLSEISERKAVTGTTVPG
jgi:hypothetical protein